MVAVRINGEDTSLRSDGLSRIADVIELIKSSIDPDHMITSLLIDDKELTEADWTGPTTQYETSIIEVETGTPSSYVADRFAKAPEIIRACYIDFRDSRKGFQNGEMKEANELLINAVGTLQAFFEWYSSLLELIPEQEREEFTISESLGSISEICKRICQQQLYQSWWALGESIRNELEPELDKLEDTFREFAKKLA